MAKGMAKGIFEALAPLVANYGVRQKQPWPAQLEAAAARARKAKADLSRMINGERTKPRRPQKGGPYHEGCPKPIGTTQRDSMVFSMGPGQWHSARDVARVAGTQLEAAAMLAERLKAEGLLECRRYPKQAQGQPVALYTLTERGVAYRGLLALLV